MKTIDSIAKGHFIPLLPIRDMIVFPHMVVSLVVGRESSIQAVEAALEDENIIFLACQKDSTIDTPSKEDIYQSGTIATIIRMSTISEGKIKILVQGIVRAKVEKYKSIKPFFMVKTENITSKVEEDKLLLSAKTRALKERLEREFDLDLIATAPSVIYNVYLNNGNLVEVQNPSQLPEINHIDRIEEPYVKATVITPSEYLGNIMTLLISKRGIQDKMTYLNEERVMLEYSLPMNEIIVDFYDKLKSISKGYASFDYEPTDFKEGDLVKLDVKVAGEVVDALSIIVPRTSALSRGRILVKNMKELIPRQLFEVAVQASLGNQVIARETVKSMGKNVTAKCYGADITRKRKLLDKQKAGKKRMKSIGKVQLPQEAFMSVLKMD